MKINMAMGGGVFRTQDKALPGAYINFVSLSNGLLSGERGIASLPVPLSWGKEGKVIRTDWEDFRKNAVKLFGYKSDAPELLLLREALKRAQTLLVYRMGGNGVKAAVSAGGLTVTAKYSGKRGNDLKIAVEAESGSFDVVTYLGSEEMDRQNVSGVSALVDNDFVSFTAGEGELAAVAAAPLTGGTDGELNSDAYSAYLAAVEVEEFNTLGYPGGDDEVKTLFVSFVKRLRDEEGKKITCVLADKAADYEGVINVKNGVVLEDGTILSAEKAVAWVTGATAGADINESLLNTPYDGAADVDVKYTRRQYADAIKAGEFVFYAEGGKARVLDDINSFVTEKGGKSGDWSSNRVVRVLDGWANDVAAIFSRSYLGAATNNDTGRQLFKADLVSLANQYQAKEAIQGFVSSDIEVNQGDGKKDVAVTCVLQPCDSMAKLYMIVQVA